MANTNERFTIGDRVTTQIGDASYAGVVIALSTFGPVNPKDYVAVRDDSGRAHLGLRKMTRAT